MAASIVDHLVVPVANEADARATAAALEPYEFGRVTAVHVVEKAGGAPDKLPLSQAEQRAEDALAAFREHVPDAGAEVTYSRDVAAAISDVAGDVEASAIAFRPRGGSRWTKLLTGDVTSALVNEGERPVVALPDPDGGEDA